jgi:hypothetical protein
MYLLLPEKRPGIIIMRRKGVHENLWDWWGELMRGKPMKPKSKECNGVMAVFGGVLEVMVRYMVV